MSSVSSLSEGAVVEFADKGKFSLAVVVGLDAKGDKLRLITQLGREQKIAQKQVLHVLPTQLNVHLPDSNIATLLSSLATRAEAVTKRCELKDLWENTIGDLEKIELPDALSLLYTDPQAEHYLGLVRALRAERIYFKSIDPQCYALRTPEIVANLKRQADALERREEIIEAFTNEATSLLALPRAERILAFEEGREETRDPAWAWIEDYALFGQDAENWAEAELRIDRLAARLNRGFQGTAHFRARALLREIAYWGDDISIELLKYDISKEFDDAIEDEALRVYKKAPDFSSRRDLRSLECFSIDDNDTLDIDDALSLESLPNGQHRLGIHIAAPAWSIAFDSPLEREARQRATTIYLPKCRVPMLPMILSEHGLSLIPNEARAAISFLLNFDAKNQLISYDIVPSVIQSRQRISYDTAEQRIEFGADSIADNLRTILDITDASQQERRMHGSIEIDLPEFKLKYDATSEKYQHELIDSSMMSRQLVSECMVMANVLAAKFCDEHKIACLFRTQASPHSMPSPEELAEMPNALMRGLTMRRNMLPAVSSMTPDWHAGLGVSHYLQVTSPLRRYADLLLHYQLEHYFQHGSARFSGEEFSTLLAETDHGLEAARGASGEANRNAVYLYLAQHKGETVEAIIVNYPQERSDHAQVFLTATMLRANVSTKMRWPLGSLCTLKIDHVDPEQNTISLQFIDLVS